MDVLCCEDNGFETRGADFVDGDCFDGGGETGEYAGLAGGGLADGCLEDVAHIDVCDFGDGDAGLLERGFDGYSTQLRGGDCGERAIELCLLDQRTRK